MLFFIKIHLKMIYVLFDKKSGTSKKKEENCNPAHKMVEKFGKSWVLLICLSRLSHIID